MDAAQWSTLAQLWAQVPDPRARRGRGFVWSVLLSLIVAGLASGQSTPSAIGQWAREHAEQVRPLCGGRVPSEATVRRVVARPDAVQLEAHLARFTQAVSPPTAGPFATLERRIGRSLDEVEQEVIELRRRRNLGEVAPVFERAQELFLQFFEHTPPPLSILRTSPELARVKLLVAFEYCEAQAAALPWYARDAHMIDTLNRMEQQVIVHFPPGQFASERGHLFNLRAPLYRHGGAKWPNETAYRDCVRELTDAREHTISAAHEPTLHVELLRNRAHAHLLHGLHDDIGKWRTDLELADRVASGIRGEVGEQFQTLVTYSWGEGYKRLVALPTLLDRDRTRYIREALDCLTAGELAFRRYPAWRGYAMLARLAHAQCLAWIDPAEALGRLTELRTEAQRWYPSLEAKIERASLQATSAYPSAESFPSSGLVV